MRFTDDELVDLRCRVLRGDVLDEDTALALIDGMRDALDGGHYDDEDEIHCDGCGCFDGEEDVCSICGATECNRIGHTDFDALEYEDGAYVPAGEYGTAREWYAREVHHAAATVPDA